MSTFSSLTVHCARCHDHKFDPIPQRDYYRLQAVFAGVDRGDRPYDTREPDRARASSWNADADAAADRLEAIERKIAALVSPELVRARRPLKALREQLAEHPDPRSAERPARRNGYHSAIHADARRHGVGPGGPGPPGADRRDPPRPGAAGRLRRHARLRVPRPLPRRGLRRPAFAKAGTSPRIDGAAGRPQRRGRAVRRSAAGGRPARFVRVTATRLWKRTNDYVFALRGAGSRSPAARTSRGGRRCRRSTRSRRACGAGRTWWTASIAAAPGRDRPIPRRPARRPAPVADPGSSSEHRRRRGRRSRSTRPSARTARRPARRDRRAGRADQGPAAGRDGLRACSRTPRGRSPSSAAARSSSPARPSGPGRSPACRASSPLFTLSDPDDEGSRRAALADWIASPEKRAHLAVDRQPALALPFRPGDRRHAQRLRPQRLPADATRSCSTGWPSSSASGGQSLKAIHRLIVMSAVYRQSSRDDPASAEGRRRQPLALADEPPAARRRGAPRQRPGRQRHARFDDGRAGLRAVPIQGRPLADLRPHRPRSDRQSPGAPPDGLSVHRAERAQPVPRLHGLRRPEHQHAGAEHDDHGPPGAGLAQRPVHGQAIARVRAPAASRSTATRPGRSRRAFVLRAGPSRRTRRSATPLVAYAAKHGLANACRLLFNTNEFLFID